MKIMKVVLIAALLLPLSACKKTTTNSIIGPWKQVNGSDSINFSPDGTYTAKMAYGTDGQPKAFSGTYFVDGQAVSVTDKDDPSRPMTWEVKIDGSQMTVTYKQGGAVKYDGTMAQFRHL
jgi:hypothetical protein